MAAAKFEKTEDEWRAIISPEQFRILRKKGTELRGTGEYDKYFGDDIYNCTGCGTPLYKSTTTFDSGCGWPAFYEGFPGAITLMGGGLRSPALPAAGTLAMSSKEKATKHPRTNAIV
ncbi:hypothetical protein DM860_015670 [Cuscuta australis]|uniref:MsrB domain-containing protein n=1 Tax=Cuscuta australis TaxID=267555 RepID=A0A328DGE0_9ASTE|nr:hypothetical protein DM860_015670 [Cuscuta australis]